VALNTKYSNLFDRLVKTNAALKSLDDWSIAYDFSRVKKVSVPPIEKISAVPSVI